ncbi:MAG: bifunctional [glutamate--ammonia ligase]-adenylyl-L-tyrosine phosphorylase/[glutamate--ammonia-ligase] adenylyltransferase, partial [Shewanella sp.]
MRQKMRDHLLKVSEGEFDLKQSPGGITDIEFIAQYLVLANAHEYPELSIWSDNVRIFGVLAELELLPLMSAQHLTQSYCWLRDENHRLTLQQKSGKLPYADVAAHAERILAIYQAILE